MFFGRARTGRGAIWPYCKQDEFRCESSKVANDLGLEVWADWSVCGAAAGDFYRGRHSVANRRRRMTDSLPRRRAIADE